MSSPGNGNFTLDIFSAAQAAADCRWLSSWSSISHSTGEASGEGVLRIKAYPIPGLRGTNAGVYTLEGGIEHVFPQIFAGCLQLVAKIPLRMADPSTLLPGLGKPKRTSADPVVLIVLSRSRRQPTRRV